MAHAVSISVGKLDLREWPNQLRASNRTDSNASGVTIRLTTTYPNNLTLQVKCQTLLQGNPLFTSPFAGLRGAQD